MVLATRFTSRWLLALVAPLALAACGNEEPTLEADVEDQSGGEVIVTEETPAVDVDLPETPMTNVPADADAAATDTTMATEPAE